MKIVQVTPRYPPHVGGVETHVKEISERLVERGHEVTVVTADAGSDVPNRSVRNGVIVRRCRGFAPGGAFHLAPGITPVVRRSGADVVHAHNYHSLPMLFAALGADAPLIVTPHYHGTSASRLRNRLLRLYRPLGKWAQRRADAVIAVSEWECRQLRDDFVVTPDIIPNGLQTEVFRAAKPVDHERPYLLCVGRLEEYKGVQHVIRALPDLPEYDLYVVGSGNYQAKLRDIARTFGVEDRVEFFGYVDSDRLPSLYTGSTVYLLLSKFEAYGMTVAEALASGTPCVVRTGSALDDWVENSGVIPVNDLSPNSIADAVYDARNSEIERDQIVSWDLVSERIEQVYISLSKLSREESG